MAKPKTLAEVQALVAAKQALLIEAHAENRELRAKVRRLEKRHETMKAEAIAARAAAKKAQFSNGRLRDVNEDLKASRAQCRALERELARVIRAAAARTTSEEDTTEE
jgi:hypothetical protein